MQHINDHSETANIKFIHLRRWAIKANHMELDLKTHYPLGGLTVAYVKHAPNVYKVAFAHCNKKDHYIKKFGRDFAVARLLENDEVWYVSTEEGRKPFDAIVELVSCVRELRKNLK